VLLAQFDWLLSCGYPCTVYLQTKKNGFRFVPITDAQMFALNEVFVPPNTNKERHKVLFNSV
jgi:hypothetical protein